MLRRLAVLWLAIVPLMAACGQRPLLSVDVQNLTVSPNASFDAQPQDIPYTVGAPAPSP
jgi:hypothetical protein